MEAIVLAAGLGTRLDPLTRFFPKALMPVLATPMLVRHVAHLAASGVEAVHINLHHLGSMIPRALGDTLFGVALHYYEEPEILGTGGGIRNILRRTAADEPLLVVNADALFFPDVAALRAAFAARPDAAALMVVRPSSQAEALGAVACDATGRVVRLVGVGDRDARPVYMFTGVHVIAPDLVRHLPERGCIVRHTYMPLTRDGGPLYATPSDAPFWDIGTVPTYGRLNADLAQAGASLPGQSPCSLADGAVVSRTARVHPSAHVGPGTVVCDGAQVAAYAHLERCIVLPGATAGGALRSVVVLPDGTAVPFDEKETSP